jgi:hypothetical protein
MFNSCLGLVMKDVELDIVWTISHRLATGPLSYSLGD